MCMSVYVWPWIPTNRAKLKIDRYSCKKARYPLNYGYGHKLNERLGEKQVIKRWWSATPRLKQALQKKTSQECETDLILSNCILFFVFLSGHHSDQMSQRSQVSKVPLCVQSQSVWSRVQVQSCQEGLKVEKYNYTSQTDSHNHHHPLHLHKEHSFYLSPAPKTPSIPIKKYAKQKHQEHHQ